MKTLVDLKRKEDQPDVYGELPSNEATRNKLIDLLGMPQELKISNANYEQWQQDMPSQMAAMGTTSTAQKLMDATKQPAPQFGRVIMAGPEAVAKPAYGKIKQLFNK